jgi:hypothetical protein
MEQKEHILRFNRQLDRLLAGKALDMILTPSDQRALELACRLSLANFSSESNIRDVLHSQLLKSFATEAQPSENSLLRSNFSTWAWAALVLVILLVHSIGIPDPQPAFVSTSLPARVVMTMPSPNATIHSQVINSQTLKPVPIPTPLAISAIAHAQNQPFLASNSSGQPSFRNPDRTQTPKPEPREPIPHSGSRP